jgi:nicotinamide-nucleotide amidase
MTTKNSLAKITTFMLRECETISVAESVTSGQVQLLLSGANQATNFFQGGITVYNVGQKTKHLGIDPINCLSCNCVSEKIATEMASNVGRLFCSEWGIGITGYAAVIPELSIDSLFAFYAFSYQGKNIWSKRIESKKMDSKKVQEYYAATIVKDFANCLWSTKR